jgi:PEP-CTERM motif
MRISGLLAAVIALSVLAPIAPIAAHANSIEIVNRQVTLGIGMPHLTRGTFDLADPDWSFENDPNWGTEIVPCPLMPYIFGAYIACETTYHPPALPIMDPVVAAFSPVDPIGLPGGGAPVDPIWTLGDDPPGGASVDPIWTSGGDPPGGASAVPEPSTWAMLLIGFAGLGFLGWRGSRKTAARSA